MIKFFQLQIYHRSSVPHVIARMSKENQRTALSGGPAGQPQSLQGLYPVGHVNLVFPENKGNVPVGAIPAQPHLPYLTIPFGLPGIFEYVFPEPVVILCLRRFFCQYIQGVDNIPFGMGCIYLEPD